MKKFYGGFIIDVPRFRRVPTDNGFTTVVDTPTKHTVLVDVDLDRLVLLLGPRAVKSKSGKASLAGGFITVTEKRR